MRDRSPETLHLIDQRYARVGHAGPDSWYRLRPEPPAHG
jgi:hypothetical protein